MIGEQLRPIMCPVVLDAVLDDNGRTRMTFCPNHPVSFRVFWCEAHYQELINRLFWMETMEGMK